MTTSETTARRDHEPSKWLRQAILGALGGPSNPDDCEHLAAGVLAYMELSERVLRCHDCAHSAPPVILDGSPCDRCTARTDTMHRLVGLSGAVVVGLILCDSCHARENPPA